MTHTVRETPPTRYTLTSLDGATIHDASELLGPGCFRYMSVGVVYSAVRLREIAHRDLPELGKPRDRWRFRAEESPGQGERP